jgi:hypothetical protein
VLQDELKSLLEDQRLYFKEQQETVEREVSSEIRLDVPLAVILTGIRRAGKSTLLKQLMKDKSKVGYVHFDDPRFSAFQVADFYKIEQIWPNIHQFQFDEIQQIDGWESYVRQGLERGNQYAITGSNAKLLSLELGTLLTGRHITHEVFPFSFREFCRFRMQKASPDSFQAYLAMGGFPEFVAYGIPRYHTELFKDIIQRDIAVRNGIRNVQELTLVALHLLNNIARPYTLNKLAKSYGIKSANTVSNFVKFYEDSYLLFSISKFDFSFKKQQVNEKKIYAIDTKFAQQNSTQLQEDTGRILENLVFLEIRRKTTQIWYYKKNHECDFIYQLDGKYHAVQVCHQLTPDNMARETAGMQEAMADLELASTTFVTTNQTEDFHIENKKVMCIPFFDWAK